MAIGNVPAAESCLPPQNVSQVSASAKTDWEAEQAIAQGEAAMAESPRCLCNGAHFVLFGSAARQHERANSCGMQCTWPCQTGICLNFPTCFLPAAHPCMDRPLVHSLARSLEGMDDQFQRHEIMLVCHAPIAVICALCSPERVSGHLHHSRNASCFI